MAMISFTEIGIVAICGFFCIAGWVMLIYSTVMDAKDKGVR